MSLARCVQHRCAMQTGKSFLVRLTVTMATSLAMLTPSWAQMHVAITDSKAPHWHEYVNRQYGVLFFYPDPYKPTVAGDRCKDNYYVRYLLCLAPTGGSDDPAISVSVIVAEPFHVFPGAGDGMPTRQRIGRHVFYCVVVGSMGVGFSDSCVLNLKGKTLQFLFNPLDGLHVNDDTKQIETTMLETLRIL
jgi:hypothetical protein